MLCCSQLSASKNLLKVPQLHWRQQRKHTVTAASVALSFTATYKDFMIIMPPDDVQEVLLKSSGSEHLSAVISVSEASASSSLISPETTESIPVLKSIHLPGICTQVSADEYLLKKSFVSQRQQRCQSWGKNERVQYKIREVRSRWASHLFTCICVWSIFGLRCKNIHT